MKLIKFSFIFSLLLPVCMLAMLLQLQVQPLQWQWVKSPESFGSSQTAVQGWDLVADAAGNAYVSGQMACDSLVVDSVTTLYSPVLALGNVFIIKYDSLGNVKWAINGHGYSNAQMTRMGIDAEANIFLAGIFQGGDLIFGNDTLTALPSLNVFLVKLDSSGNVLWARSSYGPNGSDYPYGMAVDAGGNAIVTGAFHGPVIYFGTDSLINSGQNNIFLAKYDADGNVAWVRGAGGTYSDYTTDVSADAAGNIYITGQYESDTARFGSLSLPNSTIGSPVSAFVAKYDSSGTALWARSGNGPGVEYGKHMLVSSTGNLYVSGFFIQGDVVFGNDTVYYGTDNTFFVKYDAAGNVLWAKSLDGLNPYKMLGDVQGKVYMSGAVDTGYVTNGSVTLYTSPAAFDTEPMFLAKLDSSGNALWGTTLTSGGSSSNGFDFGPDGSLYIGSAFVYPGPFTIGSFTLQSIASLTLFIAKSTGIPGGLGIAETFQNPEVSVFPNPFKNEVHIRLPEGKSAVWSLYDLTSRKLLSQKISGFTTLSLSSLASGMYIYELEVAGGFFTNGKIVKQ